MIRSSGQSVYKYGTNEPKDDSEIIGEAIRRWGGMGPFDYAIRYSSEMDRNRSPGALKNILKAVSGPLPQDVIDAISYNRGLVEIGANNLPYQSWYDLIFGEGTRKNIRTAARKMDTGVLLDDDDDDKGASFLFPKKGTRRKKDRLYFDRGGIVTNVPNVPIEPDERVDKMTGEVYNKTAEFAQDKDDRELEAQRKSLAIGGLVRLFHGSGRVFNKFDTSKSEKGALGKGFYFTDDKKIAKKYSNLSDKDIDKMYGKKYKDEVKERKSQDNFSSIYEVEVEIKPEETILNGKPLAKQNKIIKEKIAMLSSDLSKNQRDNIRWNSGSWWRDLIKELKSETDEVFPSVGINVISKDLTKSKLKGKTLGGDIEYNIMDPSILSIINREGLAIGGLVSALNRTVYKAKSNRGQRLRKNYLDESQLSKRTPVRKPEDVGFFTMNEVSQLLKNGDISIREAKEFLKSSGYKLTSINKLLRPYREIELKHGPDFVTWKGMV